MANVGSGANGNTYIGTGNGKSGTFVPIGTFSGLTDHGVVIAQGNGAFVASSPGTAGQILTSNGASADPTFQAAPSGGIVTIDGDTGSITGSTVTIYANQATRQAGASVAFVNSGSTSTFEVTDSNNNTLIGYQSGPTAGGAYKSNTSLGAYSLQSMSNSASATDNTSVGLQSLQHLTTGGQNVSVGSQSLAALTTGADNTCIGYGPFGYITTGSSNIGIGNGAGYLCKTGNESGNIYLGNYGVNGESNAMRLGLDGVTSTAYMSGVNGVTVSNPLMVVMNSSTRQMGTQALPSSGSWVLIQSQNASSSAALTFTSGITSTYNNFILVISNMVMSTTAFIYVQLSSDGGSTYKSSSYLSGDNFFNYNSASNSNNNGTGGFIVGNASDNTYFNSSTNWLNNVTSGTNQVNFFGDGTSCNSSSARRHYMLGTYTGSALTVNAIQVIGSSGTITSGTATLYGLLE